MQNQEAHDKNLPLSHRRRSGSETRQKGSVVQARVSEREREIIERDAMAAGATLGSYVRERLLTAPQTARRRRPHADVAALSAAHRQVRAIGGNLNQIARSLNLGEMHAAGDLPHVLAEVKRTLQLVRQAMGFAE